MGDIFSLGFGPFRWVCTSADPADLRTTDAIAKRVLEELKAEYQSKGQDAASGADGDEAAYAARAVPQINDNLLW